MAHYANAKAGVPFHKREEERRWNEHLKKHQKSISAAKPTLPVKKKTNEVSLNNARKLRQERERLLQIEYENKVLLEKIGTMERRRENKNQENMSTTPRSQTSANEEIMYTKLQWAVYQNDVKKVENILRHDEDPDEFWDGWTLLTSAITNNYYKMSELLLEFGAKVDKCNPYGNYPIHCAVQCAVMTKNFKMLTLLRSYDADPNKKEKKSGNTALHLAVSGKCSPEILEALLLFPNIDCSATNKKGKDVLAMTTDSELKSLIVNKLHEQNIGKLQSAINKFEDKKYDDSPDRPEQKSVQESRPEQKSVQESSGVGEVEKLIREKETEMTDIDKNIEELHKNIEELSLRKKELSTEHAALVKVKAELSKSAKSKKEEKSAKKVLKVEHLFECPICFIVPFPPKQVVQCTNGHSMCRSCKLDIDSCPICCVDLSITVRNFGLEKVLAESQTVF